MDGIVSSRGGCPRMLRVAGRSGGHWTVSVGGAKHLIGRRRGEDSFGAGRTRLSSYLSAHVASDRRLTRLAGSVEFVSIGGIEAPRPMVGARRRIVMTTAADRGGYPRCSQRGSVPNPRLAAKPQRLSAMGYARGWHGQRGSKRLRVPSRIGVSRFPEFGLGCLSSLI